ncbi:MAG: uncharacterized protein A8A55_1709 [Amphiamblys sp. WSBS2006]|nr:MAG: uncharacterized protein A8A55_1709 [Amphiamblys sp. WSBS2006]
MRFGDLFAKDGPVLSPLDGSLGMAVRYLDDNLEQFYVGREQRRAGADRKKKEASPRKSLKRRLSELCFGSLHQPRDGSSESFSKENVPGSIGLSRLKEIPSVITIRIYQGFVAFWDFQLFLPINVPIVADILTAINERRIPVYLGMLLNDLGFSFYYDGSIVVSILDCRTRVRKHKALLRPSSASISCNMHSLVFSELSSEVFSEFEKNVVLRTEEPLFLEPNINAMLLLNYFYYDSQKDVLFSEKFVSEVCSDAMGKSDVIKNLGGEDTLAVKLKRIRGREGEQHAVSEFRVWKKTELLAVSREGFELIFEVVVHIVEHCQDCFEIILKERSVWGETTETRETKKRMKTAEKVDGYLKQLYKSLKEQYRNIVFVGQRERA